MSETILVFALLWHLTLCVAVTWGIEPERLFWMLLIELCLMTVEIAFVN